MVSTIIVAIRIWLDDNENTNNNESIVYNSDDVDHNKNFENDGMK